MRPKSTIVAILTVVLLVIGVAYTTLRVLTGGSVILDIGVLVAVVAAATWALVASRNERLATEREQANRDRAAALDRARNPDVVRCGEGDTDNPFYCGKLVPVWFVEIDDNGGPPRCGRCMAGVPGHVGREGLSLIRYPRPRETEEEYKAYVREEEAKSAAIGDEYERLAKDFPLPTSDTDVARIAGPLDDERLRVARDDKAEDDVEAESEADAASRQEKA